jgi:molybdopterin converting factor small subunit
VEIIVFGQLTEITGHEKISINSIADTNTLVKELHHKFPELMNTRYVIAVDKKIVLRNTSLSDKNTVALLPPFSGG